MPATSIPGSDFVDWARTQSGTEFAKEINRIAEGCLKASLSSNSGTIPKGCETKTRLLNNSEARGSGITGFNLTNGLNALKQAMCSIPQTGTNYPRNRADEAFD